MAASSPRLAANRLQLGEVAEIEDQIFNLVQMIIKIQNVQFNTKPPLL